MRRFLPIVIAFLLTLNVPAQTSRTTQKKRQTTTTTRKKTTSKTTKKTTSAKKKTSTAKKKTTKKAATASTSTIKGLQNKRSKIQSNIKKQEQALRKNKADVTRRLRNLLAINTEIDRHKKNIDNIEKDIRQVDNEIELLNTQIETLQKQLDERKEKYIKSMRYITRQHTVQDRLMFIFAASNFSQMYRRMRFVREYASFQRAQGEAVKTKQGQLDAKRKQLETVKASKNRLLDKGQRERTSLEGKQTEQQKEVKNLQKQQKTIQQVIAQQRKEDAALNAEIDRLIAEEVAKAQARAAAEAKKREEAEAAKRRAAELARKKAEAEAARIANEKLIAEAKKRESQAKEAARKAAEKNNKAAQERAEQQARAAEADRKAAELKAETDARRRREDISKARKSAETATTVSSVDRKLSGSFESNKGRLPMPITGSYRIVSHFGNNNVEGLKGVTLDNKGINIKGTDGCRARAVYDGEVSAVFSFGGTMVVMVRHGIYISVYCNLKSVSVQRGEKVATRQVLGYVARDNILQFQLRRNMSKLNPESWIGK